MILLNCFQYFVLQNLEMLCVKISLGICLLGKPDPRVSKVLKIHNLAVNSSAHIRGKNVFTKNNKNFGKTYTYTILDGPSITLGKLKSQPIFTTKIIRN